MIISLPFGLAFRVERVSHEDGRVFISGTIQSEVIRAQLMDRAEKYIAKTGSSLSAIGTAAVGDSKFLFRVKGGKGFTIDTYQRVIDWLDAAEAKGMEALDA